MTHTLLVLSGVGEELRHVGLIEPGTSQNDPSKSERPAGEES